MFNTKIHIQPEEVMKYYKEHSVELLEKMMVIAETTYDDTNEKCYLFLTEDSGKPFVTLESSETIMDSAYLTENNYKEIVLRFLEKLDKTSPLILKRAEGSLPNEKKFYGAIMGELDSYLVNKSSRHKTYLLNINKNWYIRLPGKTIGKLELGTDNKILSASINKTNLELFKSEVNAFLRLLKGYTVIAVE